MTTPILEVTGLSVAMKADPTRKLVDDISIALLPGQRFGLVGESGSGKTLTLRSILGILRPNLAHEGDMFFDGHPLSPALRREVVGSRMAYVPQDSMAALNPVRRVGSQMMESIVVQQRLGRRQARDRCIDLLNTVGIQEPETVVRQYPHELSGGMRQRVVIAMATCGRPSLLLCDEPTSSLDVTVQRQITDLLQALCSDFGASMVFVSHDIALVSNLCDVVGVIYGGRLVEVGPTAEVMTSPRHAYTQALLETTPSVHDARPATAPPGESSQAATLVDCKFAPRCRLATSECTATQHALAEVGPNHHSACIHALSVPTFREGKVS